MAPVPCSPALSLPPPLPSEPPLLEPACAPLPEVSDWKAPPEQPPASRAEDNTARAATSTNFGLKKLTVILLER
jgi:hypothetical protein